MEPICGVQETWPLAVLSKIIFNPTCLRGNRQTQSKTIPFSGAEYKPSFSVELREGEVALPQTQHITERWFWNMRKEVSGHCILCATNCYPRHFIRGVRGHLVFRIHASQEFWNTKHVRMQVRVQNEEGLITFDLLSRAFVLFLSES